MNNQLLVPVFLSLIGLWLAGFGLATRRRPRLVAGFDPSRCSDPRALSRWVGSGGVILGCICLSGAILTFMAPGHRRAISIVLSLVIAAAAVVIIVGARRFRLSQP